SRVERAELQRQAAVSMRSSRRFQRAELFQAIRDDSPGGKCRYRAGDLAEEFRRNIPKSIWARMGNGLPTDEVAAALAQEWPWIGVATENDLYRCFSQAR